MLKLMAEVNINCLSIEFLDDLCQKTLIQAKFKDWRRVCFAVHEAVVNSIEAMSKKFNEKSIDKTISLKIYADEKKVEIHVIDEADGIPIDDFQNINNIKFEDILLNEEGRGLLMIKQLVDEVRQEYGGDGKYILKMYKKMGE